MKEESTVATLAIHQARLDAMQREIEELKNGARDAALLLKSIETRLQVLSKAHDKFRSFSSERPSFG